MLGLVLHSHLEPHGQCQLRALRPGYLRRSALATRTGRAGCFGMGNCPTSSARVSFVSGALFSHGPWFGSWILPLKEKKTSLATSAFVLSRCSPLYGPQMGRRYALGVSVRSKHFCRFGDFASECILKEWRDCFCKGSQRKTTRF